MKLKPQLVLPLICFIISFYIPLFGSETLPGFTTSPYFDEQVATFHLKQDMRIQINAPSTAAFDPQKPVGLVLFALPNGNTIEQTAGIVLKEGDDWHYDIQHIAAQARFLRQKIDYNLVVVYLEAATKSWPAWKRNYPHDHAEIIKQTIDYLTSLFSDYHPFVVLNGHSGGGRFIFSFLDAQNEIPANIKRIAFLDSNYGYEQSYGKKIAFWLKGSDERCLAVFAYNDSIALYNGKPIVSATGGTWYRSKMMLKDLTQSFAFTTIENDSLIQHSALDGRIKIYLKKNHNRKILHTQQVERNGFIHSMLTGTKLESQGYSYYAGRCYSSFIQQDEIKTENVSIPLRSPLSPGVSVFMQSIADTPFEEREQAVLDQFLAGNVPYFLRELKTLKAVFSDSSGIEHNVAYRVFPDYLAIGTDDDYCRMPMGPLTAQKIADFFGAVLPTRKLVEHIYQNAEIKLAPVPYKPVGDANEQVSMFVRHNGAIDSQLIVAGGHPGQLVAGIKKDVVLSNKLADSTRTHHVTIYGWHRLTGIRIQPLTNIHIDSYVDYSHGIRLLDRKVKVDGKVFDIETILKDRLLYTLLSDEGSPMTRSSY